MDAPSWIENVSPFMEKAAGALELDGEEISVMFCGDSMIRELNSRFRQIDSATDVLSFEDGGTYADEEGEWRCMGDIVISLETVPVNSEYFDENKDSELKRLLVHGLLHLNGMDHGDEHIEKDRAPDSEMLVLQEKVLENLRNDKIIL